MGLVLLTERHAQQISGVLSCYDRVMVQGTLPVFCYAEGMTAYLSKRRIRIFDFTQFAKPLTDAIKANAEQVATANGLTIDYVRKKNFRKEDKVKAVLKQRDHSLDWCGSSRPWSHALPTSRGMTKTAGGPIFGTTEEKDCNTNFFLHYKLYMNISVFSALEPCTTYQPWHDKNSGRTYLRYDDGKCLHYYFYFIDEDLGLCYVRVPTWCPFRLQF